MPCRPGCPDCTGLMLSSTRLTEMANFQSPPPRLLVHYPTSQVLPRLQATRDWQLTSTSKRLTLRPKTSQGQVTLPRAGIDRVTIQQGDG